LPPAHRPHPSTVAVAFLSPFRRRTDAPVLADMPLMWEICVFHSLPRQLAAQRRSGHQRTPLPLRAHAADGLWSLRPRSVVLARCPSRVPARYRSRRTRLGEEAARLGLQVCSVVQLWQDDGGRRG
jgi:hypothetical protein